MEEALGVLFYQNDCGVFSNDELQWLQDLEKKKHVLLDLEETKWRPKSHATWRSKGGNNT